MAKGIVLYFHNEVNEVLFEKIILALKARYRLVSAEELEERLLQKQDLKNICHISFDDGERSFYDTVFPLLKKHQVPVSLFVSPEIIASNKNYWFQEINGYDVVKLKNVITDELQIAADKIAPFTPQDVLKSLTFAEISKVISSYQQQTGTTPKAPVNMNVEELRIVDRSGLVTIGAHTINHPILKNEDDQNSDHEIVSSIKMLEELLQHPVKYFAYPNGRPGVDFGEREISYLQKNGITLAFSTELGCLSPNSNMLSLPRNGFGRMGLSPSNPLIYLRLSLGKKWIDIKSIARPSEKKLRRKINAALGWDVSAKHCRQGKQSG